jgi:hypothetical protein
MRTLMQTAMRMITCVFGRNLIRGSRAGSGSHGSLARAPQRATARGPRPAAKLWHATGRHAMRLRAVRRTWCGLAICAALASLAPWSALPSQAQGSRKDDVVFNAQGRPMAGAAVRVCTAAATGQPCAPLANIYSDAALTQALANPTTTDGMGNYSFYAPPGRYMIEINGPGITTKQLPNVILPNDPSAPTFTSLTTTSGINAFSLSLSGNLTVTGSTAVTGALTVGGAAVPSTGQANTWSAAQTFNQDVIAGSKVPWTDVRATGAVCNGSTDDSSPLNTTISGMLSTGGTALVPDNCKGSITDPAPSHGLTVALGGRFNPTSTMHVSGYGLTCHEPYLNSPITIPFDNAGACLIATNAFSPVVSLESGSGYNGVISGLAFYGSGTQLAMNKSANTVFRDIWSQTNSNTGIPFQGTNGFGYYFERGGFLANSPWPTGAPAMKFITDPGGAGCDPPRIILLDRTFFNQKGLTFDNHLCPGGGDSTFVVSHLQLYEGGSDCMFCLDVTGGAYGVYDLFEPIAADNVGGLPTPIVQLTGTPGAYKFYSSFMLNPGAVGPIYRQPPGTNTEGPHLFDGVVEIGCFEAYCPLGIYGYSNSFFNINKHGGLTTYSDHPSAAFGGGIKIPFGPPSVNLTPSSIGGSLPAGLTCYMIVVGDSLSNYGFPSGDICTTLTGSTSSVSLALAYPNPGATNYLIYRRTGGPIEDDLSNSTVSVAVVAPGAFPYTDTGATLGNYHPTQMEYDPTTVAATDQLTGNGGWLGVGGCIAIGKQGCTGGVPGDLQIAGKVSAANLPLAGSATLTFGAITAQTCSEQTVAVTGAASTGVASASPTASLGSVNLSWSAWVSAANTVSVRVCNPSSGSITPSAVTWQTRVIQ